MTTTEDYIRRLIEIESGNDPGAVTGSNRGYGQFSRDLEQRYGLNEQNWQDYGAQRNAIIQHSDYLRGRLRQSLGREPEDWETYFAHQQGEAGGPALLANPDQPAWRTIRRFYRDDATAQRAIMGNIPYDDPLANADPNTISGRQFSDLWRARWSRAGGGRGMAEETDEFGNPIPRTAAPTPTPAPARPGGGDVRSQTPQEPVTWSNWLSQPQNRAFLISAGINMMMPSWGGPMAQIASGIGAGAEAAAATQKAEEDRQFGYDQLTSREREGALDRSSRERIADVAAGSRLEVANVRSRAMLERARIIGLRTPAQQNEFTRLVGRLYNTEIASLIAPGPAERDAAFQRAMEQAEQAMRGSGRTPSGTPIEQTPSRTPTTPTTPGEPAPTPGQNAPLVAPPGVTTTPGRKTSTEQLGAPPVGQRRVGSTARSNVAPRPEENVSPREPEAPLRSGAGGISWDQFIANPVSERILRNPVARERLLRARTDFAVQIQEWMRVNGVR